MFIQYYIPTLISLASVLRVHGTSPFISSESLLPRATVCNGHPEFCSRSFGNITFVGAHDSYAIGVNNVATNQDQPITQQLNDGIRMLQVQAHNQNGVIRLCHTSCSLYDGGSLQDYLSTVKQWLDTNPNEVLSLLIVNADDLPVSNYGTVFKAAGVDTISYAPSSSPVAFSDWPTLGSLIDSGKRLLTFMDFKADITSVPYIIDEFTNIWETAFDVVDPSFDCSVNRSTGNTATEMYLINHFLDTLLFNQLVPFVAQANVTNAVTGFGSLGAQVNTCTSTNGRPPNFMLVDFYEFGSGSVFQVAANINGVTYSPTTPVATPASTNSASTTTGTGSSISVTSKHLSGASSSTGSRSQSIVVLCTFIALLFGPLVMW